MDWLGRLRSKPSAFTSTPCVPSSGGPWSTLRKTDLQRLEVEAEVGSEGVGGDLLARACRKRGAGHPTQRGGEEMFVGWGAQRPTRQPCKPINHSGDRQPPGVLAEQEWIRSAVGQIKPLCSNVDDGTEEPVWRWLGV